jgi:hypothetical protein
MVMWMVINVYLYKLKRLSGSLRFLQMYQIIA